jgi:hypothetical protein
LLGGLPSLQEAYKYQFQHPAKGLAGAIAAMTETKKYPDYKLLVKRFDGSWELMSPGIGTFNYARDCVEEWRRNRRCLEAYLVDLQEILQHIPPHVLTNLSGPMPVERKEDE